MKTLNEMMEQVEDIIKDDVSKNTLELLRMDLEEVYEAKDELELEVEEHETYESKYECTDYKITFSDMKMQKMVDEQKPSGDIYTIIVKAR